MMKKKLNIGIVGLGAISNIHIPILLGFNDINVKAASEVNIENGRAAAKKYEISELYTDYNEMYENAELDAVFVCLPNFLHYDAIKNALERDLHVFCEKPMGTSSKSAKELVQIARKRNLILAVGYNRRLESNYQQAADIIKGKTLGRILQVHAILINPGPYITWKPSTNWLISGKDGVLYDTGCHLFDLVMHILGDKILEVNSVSIISSGVDITDNIAGSFRTEKGTIGTFNIGWRTATSIDQIEIYGTGGTLSATPLESEVCYSTYGPLQMVVNRMRNIKRIIRIQIARMGGDKIDDTYIKEDQAFIEAIVDNKKPCVSGDDAVLVLEVLEKINESIDRNIRDN